MGSVNRLGLLACAGAIIANFAKRLLEQFVESDVTVSIAPFVQQAVNTAGLRACAEGESAPPSPDFFITIIPSGLWFASNAFSNPLTICTSKRFSHPLIRRQNPHGFGVV